MLPVPRLKLHTLTSQILLKHCRTISFMPFWRTHMLTTKLTDQFPPPRRTSCLLPARLAAPLMFTIQSLFSKICREHNISMKTAISQDRDDKLRTAVDEILKTKDLSFPRQVIFKGQGQQYIYFNGSLQGQGACIYACSLGQFYLLTSSGKIMGKAAYSAPQSKMSEAVLAVKMQQKIPSSPSSYTYPTLCSWETRRSSSE